MQKNKLGNRSVRGLPRESQQAPSASNLNHLKSTADYCQLPSRGLPQIQDDDHDTWRGLINLLDPSRKSVLQHNYRRVARVQHISLRCPLDPQQQSVPDAVALNVGILAPQRPKGVQRRAAS